MFCPKAARGLLGGWGTPPRLGARIWFAWICPKKATCSCEFCSQSAKRADAKRPLPHQFRQIDWSAVDIWFILSEQRWCGKLEAPVIVLTEERGLRRGSWPEADLEPISADVVSERPERSMSCTQYGRNPGLGCCRTLQLLTWRRSCTPSDPE